MRPLSCPRRRRRPPKHKSLAFQRAPKTGSLLVHITGKRLYLAYKARHYEFQMNLTIIAAQLRLERLSSYLLGARRVPYMFGLPSAVPMIPAERLDRWT